LKILLLSVHYIRGFEDSTPICPLYLRLWRFHSRLSIILEALEIPFPSVYYIRGFEDYTLSIILEALKIPLPYVYYIRGLEYSTLHYIRGFEDSTPVCPLY
jgi:hypothetical protein